MIPTLLAIDPGLRGCGLAYFVEAELVHANYYLNPVRKGGGPEAWFGLGESIFFDFKERGFRVDHYVVEVPQVYRNFTRGDPNDLVEIAAVGAAIGATFPIKKAVGYRPREWKGQIKKEIHHPRILGQLSPAEQANIHEHRKTLRHNVIDAIGLGLYYLERMRIRTPNAR